MSDRMLTIFSVKYNYIFFFFFFFLKQGKKVDFGYFIYAILRKKMAQ